MSKAYGEQYKVISRNEQEWRVYCKEENRHESSRLYLLWERIMMWFNPPSVKPDYELIEQLERELEL